MVEGFFSGCLIFLFYSLFILAIPPFLEAISPAIFKIVNGEAYIIQMKVSKHKNAPK